MVGRIAYFSCAVAWGARGDARLLPAARGLGSYSLQVVARATYSSHDVCSLPQWWHLAQSCNHILQQRLAGSSQKLICVVRGEHVALGASLHVGTAAASGRGPNGRLDRQQRQRRQRPG